ncbi:4-substituted benzoates-glutamate ligase GH3.12 [Cardamine amara subsp. amara]|uniref:4-substituted benzoates-glutamate ligase GH3.12 n=1 Tax=Cardamine amara subsp. amara TaxID=228776 RepID=A0ABD1B633_CARAN
MRNLSFDPKDLEELTSNAKQIQDDVLEEILTLNANTEYLQRFLHGCSDKDLFKKNVPVVSYEDVKPFIDRVANGEPSDIISGKPITGFLMSSGTSGGKQKIFPANNKFFEDFTSVYALSSQIISKHIDGVQQGKAVPFFFARAQSTTPSGLHVSSAFSSYLLSDYFKNWSSNRFTSPNEVTMCPENKQSMYCHLLCGLVQREEVVSLAAPFASSLVGAITFLENHWKELCSNIRSGHVSEWITDLSCRDSVANILGGPNSELADLLEEECRKKSWNGIITRLWPKTKFIETIVTGQMSQYIQILEFYSNKLPLYSPRYASSESIFGVNVNPLCKPQDVSYTFLPNFSYFEFISVDEGNNEEIVDLVDVKLGCFYEPLVTNYSGLHRYRMGDILQVSGFHNTAPQFRFVQRKNVVLSVSAEATTEEDVLKALNHATLVLKSSDLILMGFTCYVDISTLPGHYVFYWELKAQTTSDVVNLDNKVLVECCCTMEESFNALYRKVRKREGSIGALEIRVVQQGTFDSLMEFFIFQGASSSQYKTPICIKSSEALAILEKSVLARFFSDKVPL